MRLPTDVRIRFLAIGLTAMLAACGRGADGAADLASGPALSPQTAGFGPEADYPVVLGEPYTVDGQLFTPVDVMNYDEVGYAAADPDGGAGITASHKTLPLPSYVEVTSLDSGKTALVRVERRGPMTSQRLVGLSGGALAQLGLNDGGPIRIRRVNALEIDRAKLRMGEAAPDRMETPASLVAILKRKLPESGSVSLARSGPTPAAVIASRGPESRAAQSRPPATVPSAQMAPPAPVAPPARGDSADFVNAFRADQGTAKKYPLPPLPGVRQASAPVGTAPVRQTRPSPATNAASTTPSSAPIRRAETEGFVIQAAAFSSKANADRAANTIDGFVERSGNLYRVRKGPFVNRGQADAALAKVRAAGYGDARIFSAG